MEKKASKETSNTQPALPEELPAISEESSLGVIKISHGVVARIVKLATLDVPGVVSVASGGFELAGIFTKKEHSGGISVEEDEGDGYHISVHVILSFGIELAKTADQIQQAVREQVHRMTNKNVTRVDVFIDDVKMPEEKRKNGEEFERE